MKLNLPALKLGAGMLVPLPRMVRVRQTFESTAIEQADILAALKRQFAHDDIRSRIKPGMTIAVGVGSRGIDHLQLIVRTAVALLKQFGAEPFIVPAMGSHGGATAEGQAEVLAEYGITEELVGAPVRSSMETVHLGRVLDDVEVFFDKIAYEQADGIIVVSRIKPHTDFKAPIESGIVKMLGIGLGKHKGASYLHRGGMANFDRLLPAVAALVMEKTPFLFGIGLVEDAFHQTSMIELVTKEQLPGREEELLALAKRNMPRFWLQEIDALIIDQIGKNISGSGFDPNIVGRTANTKAYGQFREAPPINKVAILGLTEQTDGNAVGIGLADFTTRRTVERIDFDKVYTNAITAVEIGAGKLPLILANDREAVTAAVYTGGQRDFSRVRLVRIQHTLRMNELLVSENMLDEVKRHPRMAVESEPAEWAFDETGHLCAGDWDE